MYFRVIAYKIVTFEGGMLTDKPVNGMSFKITNRCFEKRLQPSENQTVILFDFKS